MPVSKDMKRVNRCVNKYRRLFGLNGPNGWTTWVSLNDQGEGDLIPGKNGASSEDAVIAGSCDASPAYKSAHIEFNRNTVKKYDEEELDDLVRHELLHVVTAPIYQWVDDMIGTLPKSSRQRIWKSFSQVNEAVTTHLAVITRRE
jgi:hypothetical protein